MDDTDDLADTFPAVADIDDDDLRAGVREAWALALAGSEWDDLAAVPWLPDEQARLDLPNQTLVGHVTDVVDLATGLADRLLARHGDDADFALSRDLVLAGALVHDASKLYEFAPGGDEGTAYYALLGHPYAGVHLCEAAGIPVELSHVVLSHTSRTAVDPATLEAVVVRRADEVASAAARSRALADLRDA